MVAGQLQVGGLAEQAVQKRTVDFFLNGHLLLPKRLRRLGFELLDVLGGRGVLAGVGVLAGAAGSALVLGAGSVGIFFDASSFFAYFFGGEFRAGEVGLFTVRTEGGGPFLVHFHQLILSVQLLAPT